MPEHATEACFHCGEPVQGRQRWSAVINGEEQPMCCPGCKAVAETIVASGLKDYYRHRTELPDLPVSTDRTTGPAARDTLTLYDSAAMQERFVARLGTSNGTEAEATLIIEGITCAACSWLIEHRLSQLDGVLSASLNLSNHRLVMRWNTDTILLSAIFEAIHQLGYTPAPFSATEDDERNRREQKAAIRRLAVAGIGMMQVMMLAVPLYVGMAEQYEVFFRFASMLLTTPVVLYAARPFFDAALRDLKARHLTMDVPVSLAILLAFCASIWSTFNQGVEVYFDSVCMFTFLLLLGRFLEMRARHRMGNAGNNLLSLLPNVACRLEAGKEGDTEEVIPVESIQTGDRLLIRPGQPIPADGIIIRGESAVDEAALTGEYLPVAKKPGDTLIGGTVNCENTLEIEVTATGASARLSAIVRLMDRAQQEKPRIALLADSIASRFVAAVLIISGSVFTYWTLQGNDHAFFIALSVLVVTCPCALSLATPTALTAATTALREKGLMISKGHVLETLNQINRVVFDKTGTLTEGQLQLEDILPVADIDQQTMCDIIAALEQDSAHPIASTFRVFDPVSMSDIRHHTSQGVSGHYLDSTWRFGRADFACSQTPEAPESDTGQWLLLSRDDQAMGWFLLNDTLRRSTPDLISHLKRQGLKVTMLTGDPGPSANRIADEAGIDDVHRGLSPEQKLQQVREWQSQGDRVLMVGDGINDVPVLAGADVSMAVSDATDLAKTNADTLLISGQMTLIRDALQLAGRTRNNIRQNITWALVYNLIALPLAAAGLVPPWAAAIGMSFSSLLVVLNALRLTRLPKHNAGDT